MKAFQITDSQEKINEGKYPSVPFIIKTEKGILYMIGKNSETNKYQFINLQNGLIDERGFDTIDKMFDSYRYTDVIMNTELIVKGEWEGKE
jgi:hypothetical protein